MERLRTGTEGLDDVLSGGFPESSVTLITGGPGSGKTTMCSQFVRKGMDESQKCLYITTGQRPSAVREDAEEFGIDLDMSDENLSMAHVSPSKNVAEDIKEKISDSSFERIVLDSISVFEMNWGRNDQIRKYVNRLMEHFRDIDATVLVTSERADPDKGLTRFGVAEFLVDGVIVLEGYSLGTASYRTASIVKMRRTPIDGNPRGLKFDDSGLELEQDEKV